MDDLQAVTRALADARMTHHVIFGGIQDDPTVAIVYGNLVHARFVLNPSGTYDLDLGVYDGRPETITGLLNSIRGA